MSITTQKQIDMMVGWFFKVMIGIGVSACTVLFWDMHDDVRKTSDEVHLIKERLGIIESKMGIK